MQVKKRTSGWVSMLTMAEFIESYGKTGAAKAKASAGRLLLLGMLAGFFIAAAAAATSTAAHTAPNAGAAKLICGLLFPFGLIMVVLTGAELFTGNCLISISVLRGDTGFGGMGRNLALVYPANFAGALICAAACAFSGQMDISGGALAVYTIQVAASKCALSFGNAVVLGALCNVLVCTAVVCAVSARDLPGKAMGAFFPTAFFVICGFEHCVANMYYIPAGLFAMAVPEYAALATAAGIDTAALNWGAFLLKNLLPVTIGNIAGGVGLGALLWYCRGKRGKSNG